MKLHLNLSTRDLDAGIALYSALLGPRQIKQLADYALFLTDQPALELALDLDAQTQPGNGQHFGIVVDSATAVDTQIARLEQAGYRTDVEREETCCYAVQTKVWASDPDGRRWETYVVHEESEARDEADISCCRLDGAAASGAAHGA
ncbi:MAG: ArsI/CadI family heavy metal resistance metalloenzyme [Candidatus Elarobacter sp.]